MTRSGTTLRSIPFVQPCELVLTIFVPFAAPLKVILIVQPATDSTSSREMLADVFPFHALASESYDLGIFFL